MRNTKWTTTRWRKPSSLRSGRIREFFARKDLAPHLGKDFIDGLEKNRREIDKTSWRLLTIQAPIFFFLALSLLHVDVSVSFLGISAGASKNLREVFLLTSATFGLMSLMVRQQLTATNEILQAYVSIIAGTDTALKEVLETRYGLGIRVGMETFSKKLLPGTTQWVLFLLFTILFLAFSGMLIFLLVIVQALNLIEVYQHPNFSIEAAWFVIVYVALIDAVGFVLWILSHSYQPFQTYEDFAKFTKLEYKDKKRYDKIMDDIVRRHLNKGIFRGLITRPKMKRLP